MGSPGAEPELFMAYAWPDYVLIFFFFFCMIAWPSLAPCEGLVEALCELFCEHQLCHNLLGESKWPKPEIWWCIRWRLLCVNDASGLIA